MGSGGWAGRAPAWGEGDDDKWVPKCERAIRFWTKAPLCLWHSIRALALRTVPSKSAPKAAPSRSQHYRMTALMPVLSSPSFISITA